MKIQQISLFIENKPGHIAAPARLMAEEGIDIRALFLADTQQYGICLLYTSTPAWRLNQRRHGLRRLGRERRVQHIPGHEQHFGLGRQRQALQQMLRALRHKDRSDAQPRAQSLFQQMRPFNSGQRAALASGLRERVAQIFQAKILFTLYNAKRHPCVSSHR